MAKKKLIIFSTLGMAFVVIPVVMLVIYFSDNIQGYFKFKHLCETEGGLTVYEKLEPHVGWETDQRRIAYIPAEFEEVDFVRFPDDKDKLKLLDLKYKSGSRNYRKSYEIINADISSKTKYKFFYSSKMIDDKLLVSKTILKVIDIERKFTHINFVSFGYSMFDRNKTLLGAPSGTVCHQVSFNMISGNFK